MAMMNERKSRFSRKLDHIFWFIVTMIPVFSWLLYLFTFSPEKAFSASSFGFGIWLDDVFGFSYMQSGNVIYNILNRFFTVYEEGRPWVPIFPILSTSMTKFFTWCVTIEIIHVFFDVIVFIPRLCHKWVGKAVQDD